MLHFHQKEINLVAINIINEGCDRVEYVFIEPEIIIYEYDNELEKNYFLQTTDADWQKKTNKGASFKINAIAAEILLKFSGENTYEAIVSYFCNKYNENPAKVKSNIRALMLSLKTSYGFEMKTSNEPSDNHVKLLDYKGMYPTVVSIELTSNCNIKCKHCYGFFGECAKSEIPLDQLEPLFKGLVKAGVLTVELTGGDPSTYRYISEAIEIAVSSGIHSIILLTNGISLSKKLIAVLEKHKKQVFVQIDLHSLDEAYYDWFTGSRNKLKFVKKNIQLLVSIGVAVRVVTIVTQKNIDELEDIADWSFEHGATAFAASTVVSMGRAGNKQMEESLFFSTEEKFFDFVDIYQKINKKYPGFIRIISEDRYQEEACGALINSVSINSKGKLKLCTMDTGEYFDLDFGNIFESQFKDIYDQNQEFLKEFSQITLPNAETICRDCEHNLYCNRCILRGLQKAGEKREDCIWYKNYISNELKSRFNVPLETP